MARPPHYETTDVRIDKIVVGPYENNVFVLRDKAHRRRRPRRRRQRARAAARGVPGDRRPPGAHDPRPLRPHPGRHADARRRHRRRHRDRRTPRCCPAYDFTIPDDDVIEVGDLRLRTIHTPGHTRGSTCFLLEGHPVLFSGDTLFPGGVGNTTFEGGDFPHDHPVDRPPPVHAAGRHPRAPRPRPRHDDRHRAPAPRRVGRPRLVALGFGRRVPRTGHPTTKRIASCVTRAVASGPTPSPGCTCRRFPW